MTWAGVVQAMYACMGLRHECLQSFTAVIHWCTAIIGMFCMDLCLLILQVFRTEHYSHAIKSSKKSGPLGLISILVYTIATVAIVSCAIAHPGEIQNTLLHPQQSLATVMSPAFPWRQVAFTGLLSTDFVIYIEVSFYACMP